MLVIAVAIGGHVLAVQPIAIERELDTVHRPSLLESKTKIQVLGHEERLVV